MSRSDTASGSMQAPIEITDDNEPTIDDIEVQEEVQALYSYIDLTFEDQGGPSTQVQRNPPLNPDETFLRSLQRNGDYLREGSFVEIRETTEDELARYMQDYVGPRYRARNRPDNGRLPNISFLYIKKVVRNSSKGTTTVRGIPYARLSAMLATFGDKNALPNEVCPVYELDEDDNRDPELQAVVVVPLSIVIGKRELRRTNTLPPAHVSSNESAVVTRWRYEITFKNAKARELGRRAGETILRLGHADIDKRELRADPDALRTDWREGPTTKGGAHMPAVGGVTPHPNVQRRHRLPGQKYTVFDAFCGAGGASRGIEMTGGFRVTHGVDSSPDACASHRANFPHTQLYQKLVSEFIADQGRPGAVPIRADVLHLSPPCQFFSPAKTRPAEHDEANSAALFACDALILAVRPRFATVEQTFGIRNQKFHEYFTSLKKFFLEHGYSLSWRVTLLWDYGLPARRTRMLMLAAGPGEILPPWPAPTHSRNPAPGNGLKPLWTIREALRDLPVEADMHEPDRMARLNSAPYSPDDILKECITTSGGNCKHYSGRRSYTMREHACLQGFPRGHVFRGQQIKRQIGNAFPPCAVKTIYSHLEGCMLRQDGLLPARRTVVDLIDSDDDELAGPAVAPTVGGGGAANAVTGAQVADNGVIEIKDDDDEAPGNDPDVMEIDAEIERYYSPTLAGDPISVVQID